MVEWLAGNRIRGTSAERTTYSWIYQDVGGWKEVGRTTLGSAGTTIDVSSLPDKRYLMMVRVICKNLLKLDLTVDLILIQDLIIQDHII